MATAQSAMLRGPTKKIFFKFLLPSFGAMAINSIYSIADTIFIGLSAGELGLSALTIIMPFFTLINATGVFLGVGGSILFSVARGKGDEKSKTFFTSALIAAVLAGILFCTVLNVWFYPILRMMGANDELMPLIVPYGRYVAWASPILLLNQFLVVFVRNDGAPALAMLAGVSNGLINIILDYVFIYPLKMGMPGTVLATVVGVVVSMSICSLRFFNKSSGLRLDFRGALKAFPPLAVAGGATFIMDIAPGITTLLFNNMLLKYGGENSLSYIAAYGVVCNLVVVFLLFFSAVSSASQPLMSINHGAGDHARVKKFFFLGIVSVAVLSVVMYAASAIKPEIWLKMFVSDPTAETLRIVPKAVRLYALMLFATGHNLMFGYYYQSTLKKGRSLLVSLLRGLIFTVIFVLIFPVLWGIDAIWFVMPAAEFATLIIALALWRFTPKRKNKSVA